MEERVCLISHSLQLTIAVTGYEFPQSTDQHDANWLMIEMGLVVAERRFCKTSPALVTSDLEKISGWFDNLGHGRLPNWICLGFMEPNLEFQVFRATDEFVRIGVRLGHEYQPPFRLRTGTDEALCIFELTYAELVSTAATFRRISEQFPKKQFPSSTNIES